MTPYWTRDDVADVMRRMWPTCTCDEIRTVLRTLPGEASMTDASLRDAARRLGVRKKRDPNGIEDIIRKVYRVFGVLGVRRELQRRGLPDMKDDAIRARAHLIGVKTAPPCRSHPKANAYEPLPDEIAARRRENGRSVKP